MNRRLLALYPRGWRERYGSEVASLADELISAGETTPLRAGLGLIAGAAVERWCALADSGLLAPAAAVITAVGGIALAVTHSLNGAGATRPYFETHPAGGLVLLVVTLVWYSMELIEFVRGRRSPQWHDRAAKAAAPPGWWLTLWLCVIAVNVLLYLAPPVFPSAAIRPGAVAFAAGMVIVMAGTGLRWWSFQALGGRYFNYAVKVSPDQPVVTTGPYRMLRHPGHAGQMLFCIGAGLTSANWAGLAAVTLLPLVLVIWRTRVEENTLLATLGDRYRCYAAGRKRFVPLIW